MSERVIVNDPKGMGAFIKCAAEMEIAETPKMGKGKTVLLDRYFNSEKRKDASGQSVYWHYVWDEKSHPGFSVLGDIFKAHGAKLASLDQAPTAANLKRSYIVRDRIIEDNPSKLYDFSDTKSIMDWVKAGGYCC
jgi:unsaturated rhamnogalacturonyl hydrolase